MKLDHKLHFGLRNKKLLGEKIDSVDICSGALKRAMSSLVAGGPEFLATALNQSKRTKSG